MTVRVLVVDDSATMRGLIIAMLRRDCEIDVVGQAADPLEARQAIKALNPDVITLDVEMPNMNGLEFLEKIMRLRPTPVIMVSSLTLKGAQATLKALEIGAFDCVAKPGIGQPSGFADLAEKVKAAAHARVPNVLRAVPAPQRPTAFSSNGRLIAIGSSTGGVEALITVLSQFPSACPPTLITQHMPATFTRSFAERLNRLCAPEVSEARDGDPVLPGHIYLAAGGSHLEMLGKTMSRCRVSETDPVNGHRPSVDVLFASVARFAGANAIGVILTGMGRDGALGLLTMREAGAHTLGQDEASSVVYGMPKAAYEVGAVAAQVPLAKMGGRILQLASASQEEIV